MSGIARRARQAGRMFSEPSGLDRSQFETHISRVTKKGERVDVLLRAPTFKLKRIPRTIQRSETQAERVKRLESMFHVQDTGVFRPAPTPAGYLPAAPSHDMVEPRRRGELMFTSLPGWTENEFGGQEWVREMRRKKVEMTVPTFLSWVDREDGVKLDPGAVPPPIEAKSQPPTPPIGLQWLQTFDEVVPEKETQQEDEQPTSLEMLRALKRADMLAKVAGRNNRTAKD